MLFFFCPILEDILVVSSAEIIFVFGLRFNLDIKVLKPLSSLSFFSKILSSEELSIDLKNGCSVTEYVTLRK